MKRFDLTSKRFLFSVRRGRSVRKSEAGQLDRKETSGSRQRCAKDDSGRV